MGGFGKVADEHDGAQPICQAPMPEGAGSHHSAGPTAPGLAAVRALCGDSVASVQRGEGVLTTVPWPT